MGPAIVASQEEARMFSYPLGEGAELWLAPDAEGCGLMTKAVRQLIDWAVGVRGMIRVEWRAMPGNDRSMAVAKRLGMTFEGVLRQAFLLDGVHHDVELWSVVADEWTAERDG